MNKELRAIIAALGGSVQRMGGNCTAIVFNRGSNAQACPKCGLPMSFCDQPTDEAPQYICDGTSPAGCGEAVPAAPITETIITSTEFDHTAPERLDERADMATYDKDTGALIGESMANTTRVLLREVYGHEIGSRVPRALRSLFIEGR